MGSLVNPYWFLSSPSGGGDPGDPGSGEGSEVVMDFLINTYTVDGEPVSLMDVFTYPPFIQPLMGLMTRAQDEAENGGPQYFKGAAADLLTSGNWTVVFELLSAPINLDLLFMSSGSLEVGQTWWNSYFWLNMSRIGGGKTAQNFGFNLGEYGDADESWRWIDTKETLTTGSVPGISRVAITRTQTELACSIDGSEPIVWEGDPYPSEGEEPYGLAWLASEGEHIIRRLIIKKPVPTSELSELSTAPVVSEPPPSWVPVIEGTKRAKIWLDYRHRRYWALGNVCHPMAYVYGSSGGSLGSYENDGSGYIAGNTGSQFLRPLALHTMDPTAGFTYWSDFKPPPETLFYNPTNGFVVSDFTNPNVAGKSVTIEGGSEKTDGPPAEYNMGIKVYNDLTVVKTIGHTGAPEDTAWNPSERTRVAFSFKTGGDMAVAVNNDDTMSTAAPTYPIDPDEVAISFAIGGTLHAIGVFDSVSNNNTLQYITDFDLPNVINPD